MALDQLPGVGQEADGVAEDDHDADVDSQPRHLHVLLADVALYHQSKRRNFKKLRENIMCNV